MTLLLPFMTCQMMGDLTPIRPLVADTDILVTTADRVVVGRAPARVKWTQVLDGPDRIDSATMPKWFLRQNGMKASRPELAKNGWCIKFTNHWYTLDRIVSDNETTVTFSGKSAEVSFLSRALNSIGRSSFLRTAELPTVIMDELLGGSGDIPLTDPGFEMDNTFQYTGAWWWGDRIHSVNPIDVEASASFEEIYISLLGPRMLLNYDYEQEKAGSTMVLWVGYAPRSTDGLIATEYQWSGVASRDMLPAGDGALIRVSAECADDSGWAWTNTPPVMNPVQPEYSMHIWDEAMAAGAEVNVEFWWYAADQATLIGRDIYPVSKPTMKRVRQYWPSATTYAESKGDYLRIVVTSYWPKGMVPTWTTPPGWHDHGFYIDDFEVEGATVAPTTDWKYFGSAMNVRETDILHTDGGWVEFGTWTTGASDISSAIVSNQLARIITGDRCTIYFGAGGAGSLCDIVVDGAVLQSAYDVSTACTYEITGLDNTVEHIVKLRVAAGKVAVQKFVLSPERRITVNWPDMSAAECLDSLVSIVGGELHPDTENKRIYHLDAIGQDLLAENILDLRRGSNLERCEVEARRDEVVNSLLFLGYGSGTTRLRLVVTGHGVNADGETSEELYGIQWGKYENADCQDWYVGMSEAQSLVDELQWPAIEYRLACPDDTAAYLSVGDTVRIYWDADPDDIINASVRVLEITRDNEGGLATLIVGTRVSQLPDRLVATARKIDRVSRSL